MYLKFFSMGQTHVFGQKLEIDDHLHEHVVKEKPSLIQILQF